MICCKVTVSAFHWRDCKNPEETYIVVFWVGPLYTMVLLPLPQRQGQNSSGASVLVSCVVLHPRKPQYELSDVMQKI